MREMQMINISFSDYVGINCKSMHAYIIHTFFCHLQFLQPSPFVHTYQLFCFMMTTSTCQVRQILQISDDSTKVGGAAAALLAHTPSASGLRPLAWPENLSGQFFHWSPDAMGNFIYLILWWIDNVVWKACGFFVWSWCVFLVFSSHVLLINETKDI